MGEGAALLGETRAWLGWAVSGRQRRACLVLFLCLPLAKPGAKCLQSGVWGTQFVPLGRFEPDQLIGILGGSFCVLDTWNQTNLGYRFRLFKSTTWAAD